MSARARPIALLLLAGLAFLGAFHAAPACAAQAHGPSPELVCGVVLSLEPRVLPETGVIVTRVQTARTSFTMEGGEVGDIGMWSEQYADLRVGDTVIAEVTEKDGERVAVTAPVVGASPDVRAIRVAAGYVLDGIHWADGDLPVRYHVNPTGLPAGAVSAINASAQTWENDPGSYMDYSFAGQTDRTPGARDGVFVIGSGSPGSNAVGQCRSWYYISTQQFIECDILFNTGAHLFATDGSDSSYDVQVIATHELGHTLRLLDMYDAENSGEVMFGRGPAGDTSHRTLGPGDIAGIRAIYPLAIAIGDTATVAEDTTLAVAAPGVLANDTDPDGGAFSAHLVTGVAHGTLRLAANGSYVYRPAANFNGTDSFTYRAFDGAAFTASARVTISVTSVNDAPVSRADVATADEGITLAVAAPGVLANDSDVDGDTLSASLVAGVAHGDLDLAADGSYTYRPAADYRGWDQFTYRAFDGAAYSAPVRVTITVGVLDPCMIEVSSASSVSLSYGSTFTVVGALRSGGEGLPGQRVVLQSAAPGTSFRDTSQEVTTGAGGAFSFFVKPTSRTDYRVRFAGASVYAAALSTTSVYALPRAYVGTPVAPATTSRSRYIAVRGLLRPRHAAGTYPVRVYRWRRTSAGGWTSYGYVSARASDYSTCSRYACSVRLPIAGAWRLQARAPADSGHAPALWSGYDYVTVR